MEGPVAFDTSVVIAGLMGWHDAHEPARAALTAALAPDQDLILPAAVLLEAYAVMTRLPTPHRIAPAVARQLLSGTFEGQARLITLPDADATWEMLEECASGGIAGGALYDAHIAACARAAGARTLCTFNERRFRRWAGEDLQVFVPR